MSDTVETCCLAGGSALIKQDLTTIALILAVPIVPFLFCGWYLEPQIEALVSGSWLRERPWVAASLGIGLLVADIVLPIPSSLVGTFLGALLGIAAGGLVIWIGLNLGALVGYELARWFSFGWRNRLGSNPAHHRIAQLRDHWGLGALAVCRGVPVLAEASILAAGIYRLPRISFWIMVAPANLGLALAYAILGSMSLAAGWLPLGLTLSLGLPAWALWFLARSSFGRRKAI